MGTKPMPNRSSRNPARKRRDLYSLKHPRVNAVERDNLQTHA